MATFPPLLTEAVSRQFRPIRMLRPTALVHLLFQNDSVYVPKTKIHPTPLAGLINKKENSL